MSVDVICPKCGMQVPGSPEDGDWVVGSHLGSDDIEEECIGTGCPPDGPIIVSEDADAAVTIHDIDVPAPRRGRLPRAIVDPDILVLEERSPGEIDENELLRLLP